MKRRIDITISTENKLFLEYMKKTYGVCPSELVDNILSQLRNGKIDEDNEIVILRFLGLVTAKKGRCYE